MVREAYESRVTYSTHKPSVGRRNFNWPLFSVFSGHILAFLCTSLFTGITSLHFTSLQSLPTLHKRGIPANQRDRSECGERSPHPTTSLGTLGPHTRCDAIRADVNSQSEARISSQPISIKLASANLTTPARQAPQSQKTINIYVFWINYDAKQTGSVRKSENTGFGFITRSKKPGRSPKYQ